MTAPADSLQPIEERSRFDGLHLSALRAVARLEGLDEPTEQEFERVRAHGMTLRDAVLDIDKARPKRMRAPTTPEVGARHRLDVVRRDIPKNMLLRYLQHTAVVALRSLM